VVPRDGVHAEDATHDFDVFTSDGHIALEVTAARDEEVLSTLAAAFGPTYPTPGLLHSWHLGIKTVRPGPLPAIKPIARRAPALLAVLEQHGVLDFDRQLYPGEPDSALVNAVRTLVELGVDHGRVFPIQGEPRLFFIGHGGLNADVDDVNRLVERHAHARDNLKKLGAADADERHLFVWITGSQPKAELAMHTGPPPPSPPVLPAGLDVVWAQNESGHLWRVRRGGNWEVLQPPRVEVEIVRS